MPLIAACSAAAACLPACLCLRRPRGPKTAVPTALCWHPLLGEGESKDVEDRVVTANSEYKLLEWNADNKSCRRTTLGPTFGGPLSTLLPLAPERPSKQASSFDATAAAGDTLVRGPPLLAFALPFLLASNATLPSLPSQTLGGPRRSGAGGGARGEEAVRGVRHG